MRIFAFIRNLTRRRKVEQDLADEVGSYVDLSIQRKIRDGMNETDARRDAVVELGGTEQLKEQVRDVRSDHFLRRDCRTCAMPFVLSVNRRCSR